MIEVRQHLVDAGALRPRRGPLVLDLPTAWQLAQPCLVLDDMGHKEAAAEIARARHAGLTGSTR